MPNKKISKALREIISWGYTENESGEAYARRIINYIGKLCGVSIRSGSPQVEDIIPIGVTMFEQPYGSQSPPDIAIAKLDNPIRIEKKTGWISNDVLCLEIKRSKNGKVLWNSGFPTQNTIYIFNTKGNSANGTTIVMGFDLVSIEAEQKAIELKTFLKGLKEQWKEIENFSLMHLRPMFVESSPLCYWLSHPERKEREERVFEYVGNKWKGSETKK